MTNVSLPQPPTEAQPFLPSSKTTDVGPETVSVSKGKLAYDSFGLTESRQREGSAEFDESGVVDVDLNVHVHSEMKVRTSSEMAYKRSDDTTQHSDDGCLKDDSLSLASTMTSARTRTPSLLAQYHKVLVERTMLIPRPSIPSGVHWCNARYWPHRMCGALLRVMTYSNLQTVFVVLFGNGFLLLILVMLAERIGLHWPFQVAPLNNWMFTCANVSLILSYTSSDILFLRIVLSLAGVFFCVWSATFPIGVLTDTLMWNYLMMLINLRHALILIYNSRTIRFDAYREEVYVNVFKGIMTRSDFSVLIKPSLIRYHNDGRYFAMAGDACHDLSLIVEGAFELEKVSDKKKLKKMMTKQKLTPTAKATENRRLESKKRASQKITRIGSGVVDTSHGTASERMIMMQSVAGTTINYGMGANFGFEDEREKKSGKLVTKRYEFLDSPEWIMRRSKWGQRYSVSFRATEDCVLLMWPREALIELLRENPNLETPLMGVLGVDVARKLFKTV